MFIGCGGRRPCFGRIGWKKPGHPPGQDLLQVRGGGSPAGSHKPNSAIPQAFFNREAGIRRLTTETGAGQWGGTSLSFAGSLFDIDVTVFQVRVSYNQKPYRRAVMETYGGANCVASPSEMTEFGRRVLGGENPPTTPAVLVLLFPRRWSWPFRIRTPSMLWVPC